MGAPFFWITALAVYGPGASAARSSAASATTMLLSSSLVRSFSGMRSAGVAVPPRISCTSPPVSPSGSGELSSIMPIAFSSWRTRARGYRRPLSLLPTTRSVAKTGPAWRSPTRIGRSSVPTRPSAVTAAARRR